MQAPDISGTTTRERDTKATAGARAASNRIEAGTVQDVAALILNDRGMICDCNRDSEMLFKYRRSELVWRHVSMLLPQLAKVEMLENGQPNPHLRFLCRIGRYFESVACGGEHFASALFLNLLDSTGHGRLSLIVRPAEAAASDCCGRPQEKSLKPPFVQRTAG